jgi:hypothetical protein
MKMKMKTRRRREKKKKKKKKTAWRMLKSFRTKNKKEEGGGRHR